MPDVPRLLTYLHLATVIPSALLGAWLLLNTKGSSRHRLLGKFYMALMLFTATITLILPATVGPQLFHHFGVIHLFSVLVFYWVPKAYLAARRHDIPTHRGTMKGLYWGGIVIAGAFTLAPGRLLHSWIFGP